MNRADLTRTESNPGQESPPRAPTAEHVLLALDAHVKQRAGLEFGNYGDVRAYRAEYRSILRDLHDYRTLRAAVANSSISGAELLAACKRAYSGRLRVEPQADGRLRVDYCTGQYFPTEYRRAACAVLASALWDYHYGDAKARAEAEGKCCGDVLRRAFVRMFGARLARRWFQ